MILQKTIRKNIQCKGYQKTIRKNQRCKGSQLLSCKVSYLSSSSRSIKAMAA